MKSHVFLSSVFAVATAFAVDVDSVLTRQQWPWSTDVRVEYRLLNTAGAPVNVTVAAFDGETPLPVPGRDAVTGDLYGVSGDGTHAFSIDPIKAFGKTQVSLANFKVRLSVVEAPESTNVLYRIFDLDDGAHVDVTRADILNGHYGTYETDFAKVGPGFTTSLTDVLIWTGVTNDVYKTSKLVMRRVPAAGVVWQCGATGATKGNTSINPTRKYVKLTEDYFIGVFELTQAQWKKITGSNPSQFKGEDDSGLRPVEKMTYADFRGNPVPVASNKRGWITGERINWPTNSYLHDVAEGSFCHKLTVKTGCEFDLPTEAQWEFACRAGTDSKFSSGKGETEAAAREVAWTYLDGDKFTHPVGQKAPNAYGLYDMHGNVMEMAANAGAMYSGGATAGTGDTEEDPVVDPVGKTDVASYDSFNRIKRGGSYGYNWPDNTALEISWGDCGTAPRCSWYVWYLGRSDMGGRMVCPVNPQWSPHN